MEEERWQPIPSTGGKYAASSKGRIKRIAGGKGARVGRLRSFILDKSGYYYMNIVTLEGGSFKGVHQLVAEAFLGPCPEGCEVNHKDLDKLNNRPENLEYVTHQGNVDHAVAGGRYRTGEIHPMYGRFGNDHPASNLVGENNPSAALTGQEVILIRKLYATGNHTQKDLADAYGVSQHCIAGIVTGKRWKHIPIPEKLQLAIDVARKNHDWARGEKQGSAKITEAIVIELRRRWPAESQKALAKEFGLTQGTVSAIVRRVSWTHVGGGPKYENSRRRFRRDHSEETRQKISRSKQGQSTGENNGNSKLDADTVREILRLYATGKYLIKDLNEKFKTTAASGIVRRKTWKHIQL